MQIIWDNLAEVKEFINLVGLTKLCKDEKEWGGLGYIITDNDLKNGPQKPTQESYTFRSSEYFIVTPYYKELSWLFRNTYLYVEKETLSSEAYLNGFWAACTGYFLQHKKFKAKDLLFHVLDFLMVLEKNESHQEISSEKESFV